MLVAAASSSTALARGRTGQRTRVRAHASRKQQFSETRVLRYPGGYERIVVYPVVPVEEPSEELELEENCSWFNDYCSWGSEREESELWSSHTKAAAATVESPGPSQAAPVYEEDDLFKELEQRRSHADTVKELVSTSYQVLSGCPWVAPRSLYTVTVQLRGVQTGSFYTLRTRIAATQSAYDELAAVVGSDTAAKFSISSMKDGVVAFESADDAERFCSQLEDDLDGEIDYMEMDSHDLFRTVGDVSGVVVYLPQGDFLPMPYQLQAAVKSNAGSDDLM